MKSTSKHCFHYIYEGKIFLKKSSGRKEGVLREYRRSYNSYSAGAISRRRSRQEAKLILRRWIVPEGGRSRREAVSSGIKSEYGKQGKPHRSIKAYKLYLKKKEKKGHRIEKLGLKFHTTKRGEGRG